MVEFHMLQPPHHVCESLAIVEQAFFRFLVKVKIPSIIHLEELRKNNGAELSPMIWESCQSKDKSKSRK
jgi:hypothetical protein